MPQRQIQGTAAARHRKSIEVGPLRAEQDVPYLKLLTRAYPKSHSLLYRIRALGYARHPFQGFGNRLRPIRLNREHGVIL